MLAERPKICFLSNNMLKIIGAIAMICDHMGVILFPEVVFLRIIGRLAFPIFAFLIAEGAKYTKNKLRHFLTIAFFALAIQAVYTVYSQSLEMNVMITFTLSLMIIYALDEFKNALFLHSATLSKKILSALLLLAAFCFAVFMDITTDLDYGLSGALLPVFPALFTTPKVDFPPKFFKYLDTPLCRVAITFLGILTLAVDDGGIQYWSIIVLPILMLYSGERGKLKMKYFFYVFYPLHLGLLWLIAMFISQ